MDCRQSQEYFDNLLIVEPGEAPPAELLEHIEGCPRCAREFELARQTLASLQPSHKIQASSGLKERIMNTAIEMDTTTTSKSTPTKYWRIGLWKPAFAAGIAALLLAAVYWIGPGHGSRLSAVGVLTEALAAEEALFAQAGVVHIVNEIIVKPVANPVLAQMRWIPIVSLEATGKPRFHQLKLPSEPGKGYTVDDHSWYDPATGRFVRLLRAGGWPVFANAYDGRAVYLLQAGAEGTSLPVETPVTADFRPPKSPAEFLGLAAGLPSDPDKMDASQVSDAGKEKLHDGSTARVLKVGFPDDSPGDVNDAHWLFKIRESDKTIAEMEWRIGEQSLLVVRRVKTGRVESPEIAWNLEGVDKLSGKPGEAPKVGISPDMVVPDVSVKQMVEKASFETYMFASNPSWEGEWRIADILDIVSPPHRMFSVTYLAKDGRHVVLIQSPSYNRMLGPLVKKGKVVHTSPKGIKVWSGPRDKWLANILLQSARAAIEDRPSSDRTGYVLETPAGTFPALAINGKVTEKELHALIDSLIPAKEHKAR